MEYSTWITCHVANSWPRADSPYMSEGGICTLISIMLTVQLQGTVDIMCHVAAGPAAL